MNCELVKKYLDGAVEETKNAWQDGILKADSKSAVDYIAAALRALQLALNEVQDPIQGNN